MSSRLPRHLAHVVATVLVTALTCRFVQSAVQSGAGAEPPAGFAIDLERARALLMQARALSERDDGRLWGKRLYGAILLVDPASRAVVANEPDAGNVLKPDGEGLYLGHLPARVSLANTALQWGGKRWSMILLPVAPDEIYSGSLLMHECFHRIQPRIGIPLAIPDNHHLDTAQGRTWLRLEWRALADALREPAPLESQALHDALIFRRHRRSLFPGAEEKERQLELNEGLAEYTGLRLGVVDAHRHRDLAIMSLESYDHIESPLVRRFAYASGPAYGLLLDAARPRWHRKVKLESDYGHMLERAIRFKPPAELSDEAHARAGMYDYAPLLTEEQARDHKRQERLAEYRARFVDGPVFEIALMGSSSYSFSPYQVEALDGVGTVYGTMEMAGPWGILKVTDGVLVITDEKTGFMWARVPAPFEERPPKSGAITGPGWTLDLDRAWRVVPHERKGDVTIRKRRGR